MAQALCWGASGAVAWGAGDATPWIPPRRSRRGIPMPTPSHSSRQGAEKVSALGPRLLPAGIPAAPVRVYGQQ